MAHLLIARGQDELMYRIFVNSKGEIIARHLKFVCGGVNASVERHLKRISKVPAVISWTYVAVKFLLDSRETVFLNEVHCRSLLEAQSQEIEITQI